MRVHLPKSVADQTVDAKPATYADAILHGLAKKNGYVDPQTRLDQSFPVNRAARRRAGLKARGRLDGPNSHLVRTSPRAARPVPTNPRNSKLGPQPEPDFFEFQVGGAR